MYNLMILDGNDVSGVEYPDTLSDAISLAHENEGGNSFIITGNDTHLIGSVSGSKITWKKGG